MVCSKLSLKCSQKLAAETYMRTQPEHSWNDNNLVAHRFLYQLQRHSDHHVYPTRSFQTLRNYEDVPQLPAGYAAMLLPALIPKWWFKLMDQRVVEHYARILSKINIDPKAKKEFIKNLPLYCLNHPLHQSKLGLKRM